VDTLAGVAGEAGYRETGAGQPALFDSPQGLALDRDGRWLYVADQGNRVIRRVDTGTGTTERVAGAPGQEGDADGPGTDARFTLLRGLALRYRSIQHLDDTEDLYICDGNAIRLCSPADQTVSSVAGSVREALPDDGFVAHLAPGPDQGPGWLRGWPCFNGPCAILFDPPSNSLCIADRETGTVRQLVTDTGTLTTLAGAPGWKEIRFGLLRDGLAEPLDEGYAAVPKVNGLTSGFTTGAMALSLGPCLAELAIGHDRYQHGTFRPAPPCSLTLASPGPEETKAAPGASTQAGPRLITFTPRPPVNEQGTQAAPRPLIFTLERRDPAGEHQALRGRGREGEAIRIPVRFPQPGTYHFRVRWVNEQGFSGSGEDLKVEADTKP
jgi:hypothetical protein